MCSLVEGWESIHPLTHSKLPIYRYFWNSPFCSIDQFDLKLIRHQQTTLPIDSMWAFLMNLDEVLNKNYIINLTGNELKTPVILISVNVSVFWWLQKVSCDHPNSLDGGLQPSISESGWSLEVFCNHPTVYYKYLHHIWIVRKGLSQPFYVLMFQDSPQETALIGSKIWILFPLLTECRQLRIQQEVSSKWLHNISIWLSMQLDRAHYVNSLTMNRLKSWTNQN